MASTEPMTLDEIQNEVHNLYQNGIDVPAFGEDDYTLRTAIINHYIRVWELLDGVKWRELMEVDRSQVMDSASKIITLDSGFRRLAPRSKVFVIRASDGYRKPITIYSQERLDDDDLDTNGYCWVSGRNGAFKLNFSGIGQEYIGGTIQYRFQRFASRLGQPADVPDLSNPQYLVSMTVARLFKLAGRTTDYQVNFDDAQDALSSMITFNTELMASEETESMGHRIGGYGVMGL